ncbi:unnamed protein product [Rotaria socialis]
MTKDIALLIVITLVFFHFVSTATTSCGDTPLHCEGGSQTNNTNGSLCQPPCGPGMCCSKWGFCGDTPLHCEGGGQTCQPPCGPGFCCSKWGFCGDTPLHCEGAGQRCQPPCGPGFCCSKWGFCGNTPLHCEGGGQTNTTNGSVCQPPCGPGMCCSKWGFCGDTPLHCEGAGQTCQPPCGPGFCCSKWGFCGNTPLHCEGGGQTCQPPCGPGMCCSKWGFCGNTPLHCEGGGYTNNTNGSLCQPPCGPGFCCSKWGFCGNTPLHCEGGGQTCQPPCGPGFCCSKWGFCGDTPLHCEGGNQKCEPPCAPGLCCSKWGYCGSTPEYCENQPGGGNNSTSITREQFDCIFDNLDPATRDKRWKDYDTAICISFYAGAIGFQEALTMMPFETQSQNEVMMFFAHVSHETDGLQTYEEYCGQSGQCANNYQDSWCPPVEAEPGKTYYGRGWFQLSWPCNYKGAGDALGVDLLKDPEMVAESDTLAAATALWFWKANNMGQPAREGNFGGTTQIINPIECGATPQQENRIRRYQKVRKCFGLPPETDKLQC